MKSVVRELSLANRTVLLRADLNVPLNQGTVLNDFRLKALLPTLNLLSEKKARIILATHIGRPHQNEPSLSTKHLVPWFIDRGYDPEWVPTLEEAQTRIDRLAPGSILLLENLRFFPGEHAQEHSFAQALKNLADYYVNDAWGALTSSNSSIALLPKLFAHNHKTIGLLIEKELQALVPLLKPKRPYVMILGGAKIKEKLPAVEKALDIADAVIVLPALAFTLLQAQGRSVGKSLIDSSMTHMAHTILTKASSSAGRLILPEDFLVGETLLQGPYSISSTLENGMVGIAAGPNSLQIYDRSIREAKTIFFNGTMGFIEQSETIEPLKKLLQSIAQADALSVVGGGDTVAAVNLLHQEQDFSFCSTGGGATLQYILTGSLPGLTYLS